jgi:discoidin domain receptor family protein 2
VSPWVGWRNVTGSSGPVEMTFEFDDVRNFTEVSLHMSNKFSADVQV